jgi:hypothetical protein
LLIFAFLELKLPWALAQRDNAALAVSNLVMDALLLLL